METNKKPRVAILISDKVYFKTKAVMRQIKAFHNDEGINPTSGHINCVNIYAPKIEAPKYIKQILIDIKREINKNTVIVGNFNTTLT